MTTPNALVVSPTNHPRRVKLADGRIVEVPLDWALLPPGDAGLTRRVKAGGPSITVVEKKGRKIFSRGVWAPKQQIDDALAALAAERTTPEYAKKRAADVRRREAGHAQYVADFEQEVLAFLRFSATHDAMGRALARAVTAHATPVGSGTVARTKRIEIDERAEAAVIAWMRHQTTAYDSMKVPNVKGARRELRRQLAEIARSLLELHRTDMPHAVSRCPLCTALARTAGGATS